MTMKPSGLEAKSKGPVIYLMRHGETAWSLSGQHTSRTELSLTAAGEASARKLATRLQPVNFSHVYSSPRVRARQTCELAGLGAAQVIEPDLAEWDYGDYEGLLSAEINQLRPDWSIYRDGCPNGESPEQISARADRLVTRLHAMAGNIALFSHGHFSRVLAVRWVGLPVAAASHLMISTASLSMLALEHNRPGIALWNSTGDI